jgi:putative transcriptional regulator
MDDGSPRPGQLLVANVGTGGMFAQSVVLVLDADTDGALGVILNEISQTPLTAVLPDWSDVVTGPESLFQGGPVSPNGAICLASVADPGEEPPGWRRMFSSIGLLHLDTPVELVTGAYRDVRIFAGYAGWSPGQLQAELAQGGWYLVPATYADIFTDRPQDLWRAVLRRQSDERALLATWTEDPELN